jgi:predicted ribosomally synthesized peptide with nif11-like leader
MSKEAALAFLKKVAEDPKLQEKIVAFAREQGYDFKVGELTADELGEVTGGALNAYLSLSTVQLGDIKVAETNLASPTLNSTFKF